MKRRVCGTPGCELPDFHIGPCTPHVARRVKRVHRVTDGGVPYVSRVDPVQVAKVKGNRFQLGIAAVRDLMRFQRGVQVQVPISAVSGWWNWPEDSFFCEILHETHEGAFVAEAICEDGYPIDLTASMLMLVDTKVQWNPIPPDVVRCIVGDDCTDPCIDPWRSEHFHAQARATAVVDAYVQLCGFSRAGDVIVTLDGRGNNRRGMERALEKARVARSDWPRIFTVEMDANVALAQRLLYGDSVLYTGADAALRPWSLGDGATKLKLEHLFLKDNRVLPAAIFPDIRVVYFDYCGGPPGNRHPQRCAATMLSIVKKLPNLQVFAVTISKRQHPNLAATFDKYMPTPPGFQVADTFSDNALVICRMYVRIPERTSSTTMLSWSVPVRGDGPAPSPPPLIDAQPRHRGAYKCGRRA